MNSVCNQRPGCKRALIDEIIEEIYPGAFVADDINLNAGDDAENVVAGKKNQQQSNEQRSDPRQSMRGGDNNYYTGDNSQQWIVAQINDHAQQIRELTYRLDDLPNKFSKLEGRVDIQTDKVKRLEDLEVIVRRDEVVVRPAPPPDTPALNLTRFAIGIGIFFLVIVALFVYLVVLQKVRGG